MSSTTEQYNFVIPEQHTPVLAVQPIVGLLYAHDTRIRNRRQKPVGPTGKLVP